jgi:hypothetical protein
MAPPDGGEPWKDKNLRLVQGHMVSSGMKRRVEARECYKGREGQSGNGGEGSLLGCSRNQVV